METSLNTKIQNDLEDILKKHNKADKYKDTAFSGLTSISQNAAKEDRFDLFEFQRSHRSARLTDDNGEIEFDLKLAKPEDIESIFDEDQNTLGNYAFISAISALAEKSQYIVDLFETNKLREMKDAGVYLVKFMIDGDLQNVIIDDQIASHPSQIPAFTTGKLWVLLLEKAWAKVHSTYKDSTRGQVYEILRDLTGAPSYSYDISKKEEPDFKTVEEFLKKGNIITLQPNDNLDVPLTGKLGDKNDEAMNSFELAIAGLDATQD